MYALVTVQQRRRHSQVLHQEDRINQMEVEIDGDLQRHHRPMRQPTAR
jgi:hypothetical protein